MAYIITKTNGDSLVTVPDTELNNDYSVTLVGRNYSGYGVFLNDNSIKLMENFANDTAPATPLAGQLWYNTTTLHMNMWTGSYWKILGSLVSSGTIPAGTSTASVGDMWWDTTNSQLKVWTGQTEYARTIGATSYANSTITVSTTANLLEGDIVTHANISPLSQVIISQIMNATQLRLSVSTANVGISENITFTRGTGWQSVGPDYTSSQKKSGIVPITVTDTNTTTHVVDAFYSAGEVFAIASKDVEFTPSPAVLGFETIKPGIQLKSAGSSQVLKTVQSYAAGSGGTTLVDVLTTEDIRIGDYFISDSVPLLTYAAVNNIFANNVVEVGTTTTVYAGNIVTFQRGIAPVSYFHGLTTNAQLLNGYSADQFVRSTIDNTFLQDITINGDLTVSNAVTVTSNLTNDVILKNAYRGRDFIVYANVTNPPALITTATTSTRTANTVDSNKLVVPVVSIYDVNVGDLVTASGLISQADDITVRDVFAGNSSIYLGNFIANTSLPQGTTLSFESIYGPHFEDVASMPALRALYIDGATGNVEVAVNPTTPLGVATKQYVDVNDATLATWLAANVSAILGTAPVGRTTLGLLSDGLDTLETRVDDLTDVVDTKLPINNAAMTGIPTAPTATDGTDTTQVATTKFVGNAVTNYSVVVNTALDLKAPLASPALTGVPVAPTAAAGTSTTQLATTAFVGTEITNAFTAAALSQYAPIASPIFTGAPAAVTTAYSEDSTLIATTAFVHNVLPYGMIMMWYGAIANIPLGWALCDGSNGTPNLVDRFVIGASADSSGVARTNVTGALTLSGGSKDATLPTHNHTATGTSTFTGSELAGHTHAFTGTAMGTHTHAFTGTAMSAHSHTFSGTAMGTHTHPISDPGHTHTVGALATSGSGNAVHHSSNANGSVPNTGSATTGIAVSAASAGTPAGTNSSTSAGTPAGTNASTSAGTPAGTNSTVTGGTPAGTVATTVSVANSGTTATNANLPPYYALAYIMKITG